MKNQPGNSNRENRMLTPFDSLAQIASPANLDSSVLFRKNPNAVGHGGRMSELHNQTQPATIIRIWDSFCFVKPKCGGTRRRARNCTIKPNRPTIVRIRDSFCSAKIEKTRWDTTRGAL